MTTPAMMPFASSGTLQCVCDPAEIDGYPYIQFGGAIRPPMVTNAALTGYWPPRPFWHQDTDFPLSGSIGTYFGDCIHTPIELTSFISGLLSLLCYIVALFPQIWMNFRRGSVEGLSAGLILIWAVGDLANLLGTVLTNQLPTQLFVAVYFNIVDLVIIGQFVWYTYLRNACARWFSGETGERSPLLGGSSGRGHPAASSDLDTPSARKRRDSSPPNTSSSSSSLRKTDNDDDTSTLVSSSSLTDAAPISQRTAGVRSPSPVAAAVATVALAASTVTALPLPSTPVAVAATAILTTTAALCDARAPISPIFVTIGSAAAWVCGLLYFYARIPQIRENERNRSVEGLSLGLFIFTLAGNLSYGVSILLRTTAADDPLGFIRADLPYVVGSIGVLAMDLKILAQAREFGQLKWENI
ncbi:PQ loop repeat-containing protein 2 [Irineochytrium annulatum]|nr:PQ loop repeat-containing protein 2 [Irineochytrium annulatum]